MFKRTMQWFSKYRKHLLGTLVLVPVFYVIHFTAYWLRFEGNFDEVGWRHVLLVATLMVFIKIPVFIRFRTYASWSPYVTFHDLLTLTKAVTISSLIVVLAGYFLPSLRPPISILLMDGVVSMVVIGAIRSLGRLIHERKAPLLRILRGTPVFIVGTNDSGETLLRAIRRNPNLDFRVVGFTTEDPGLVDTDIGGVRVLGMCEQTCSLADRFNVSQILITAGELSGQRVRSLMEECYSQGVSVKVLPSYEQLIRGTLDLRPREVSIEDLLSRDPVHLDLSSLHRWIDNRVLLVTGSAGSIGSEICRQLLQFSPDKLVLVDQSETGQFFLQRELQQLDPDLQYEVCVADTCDAQRMHQIFSEHRPEIIFHAAAYKHVPLMESNPGEAVKNITLASRLLADLADQYEVQSFVMISTDKAVNPTSVMGACKRIAEQYVQSLATQSTCRFVTVRFGNVLDSAGSVVPIFREQIVAGGPVTVTHPDMRRYFMMIPEASQLVIQAGAMGQGGEIFELDMGNPVSIVQLAEDMIRLSGLRVGEDIDIEFTGTRPGEKLFEELHVDDELHVATSHPKIVVVATIPRQFSVLQREMDDLAPFTMAVPLDIIAKLQQIVSEYHPPVSQEYRFLPMSQEDPLLPVPEEDRLLRAA